MGYTRGDACPWYIPELKHIFVSKDDTFLERLMRRSGIVTFDVDESTLGRSKKFVRR